ncbi:MAG: hypothetical protein GY679_03180 [Mycoplasma sp.]|nr:hypothetical protein [Mycoplasma sp.]
MKQTIPTQIIRKINQYDKIALFHNIDIEGDSLSSYALALSLKKTFPTKEIVFIANAPALFKAFPFLSIDTSLFQESIDESYLALVTNTSSFKKIFKNGEFQKAKYKIGFDHHSTSPNYNYDLFWNDTNFSSSTSQAIILIEKLKVALDESIAFVLSIGILTKTHTFTYSLADSLVVNQYAKLLEYINDGAIKFIFDFLKNKTIKGLKIKRFTLNNIKTIENLVYLKVEKRLKNKFGINEIEKQIHQFSNISSFDLWAIFIDGYDSLDSKKRILVKLGSFKYNTLKISNKYDGFGIKQSSTCFAKDWKEVEKIIKELVALRD